MTNNIRQHITLAIVTLILTVIILASVFIPHQPNIQRLSPDQSMPQNSINAQSPLVNHGQFALPPSTIQVS